MIFRDRRKVMPWRFDISFDTAGLVAGLYSPTDLRMRLNKGNEQADLLQHDINLCSVRPLSTRAITWPIVTATIRTALLTPAVTSDMGGSGPANSLFVCVPAVRRFSFNRSGYQTTDPFRLFRAARRPARRTSFSVTSNLFRPNTNLGSNM